MKEVWYCAAEDRPIEKSEIVKGYEFEKDQYVVIENDDLEKIAPPTASNMQILRFVKMAEVDPIFLEKSYYVAPEEGVSKPYSLLLEAMRATGYDAVGKVAMHGREHVVVLRPTEAGLVLHTMYFVDELHREKNTAKKASSQFDKKELDMAKTLVQHLAGPFKPEEFHDEYQANVLKMIEAKRKGRKVTPIRQPKSAPALDLMQALQKSLAGLPKQAKVKARSKRPSSKTA